MNVMSITAFQIAISQISGVKDATMRDDGSDGQVLQVAFEGEPADYSSRIAALKSEYGMKQVEAPEDARTRTPDGMPVLYFATR